jgi:TRAP-type mannitol/chloroaromatic compound transport system permease small subunit
MHNIIQYIEHFIDWAGRTVSWLTLAMVLVTFFVVLLRYTFNTGWIALQESISYMHALVFLIGAAYTLKHNEHVRVDIIYQQLSARGRVWIDLLGNIFILMPVMLFIFWISWDYIKISWSVFESSREAGGLEGLFLLKSCILLMSVLLIMQSIAHTLSAISKLLNKDNN